MTQVNIHCIILEMCSHDQHQSMLIHMLTLNYKQGAEILFHYIQGYFWWTDGWSNT